MEKNYITQQLSKLNKTNIVVCGHGGSGKGYLLKQLSYQFGALKKVLHTTRPKRKDEVNGIDYYFVTEDKFSEMVFMNYMSFYQKFDFGTDDTTDDVFYGISKKEYEDTSKFSIELTPYYIEEFKTKSLRSQQLIIYLNIDEAVRRERLLQRSDSDSVDRRIASDAVDFDGFTEFDIEITDPEFNILDIFNPIQTMIDNL